MTRRVRAASILYPLATVVVLVLASCSGKSSSLSAASGTPSTSATRIAPTSSPLPLVGQALSARLGTILVDGRGLTLYRNTNEVHGTIACTATCTSAWPPFLVPAGAPATPGAALPGVLGTTVRPDGDTQLIYNGMPLYRYANDHQPGDANGQGVGGIWFVVATPATTGPTSAVTIPATRTSPTSAPAVPPAAAVGTPGPPPTTSMGHPSPPLSTTPPPPPTTTAPKPPPTSPPSTAPRPTTPPTTPPTTKPCAYPPCY
jgi:predicted lipoprotein with Yx(FWY)xxD motif